MRQLIWTAAIVASAALASSGATAQSSVTISREVDAATYDPHKTGGRPAAEVLFMVADTLVALDYDQKTIVPNLAASWTASPDGLTYTFKLKPAMQFCDGKPLTAREVAASYARWLDPQNKSVSISRAGEVQEIRAVDDLTLQYKLKRPYPELLIQMTQHPHIVIDAEQARTLGPDFGIRAFNGSGPFCLESFTPRDRTVLVRNPKYAWGPPIYAGKQAQVDRVVWLTVPEEGTRVAALKTGQSDITQYLPHWALKELQADRRFSVTKAPVSFLTRYIGMKVGREFLTDVRVRRAMNLAVDQKVITDALTLGYDAPASTMVAPGAADRLAGLDETQYGENLPLANRLLDEAGWRRTGDGVRQRDGKRLSLLFYGFSNTRTRLVAEALQSDLRAVGIEMRIELFDAAIAFSKLVPEDHDLFFLGQPYISTLDLMYPYFHSKNVPQPNRFYWRNAQTDQWLDEAAASSDAAKRADALAKVQRQLHEAAVWIPMFHENTYLAVGARLRPMKAHALYGAAIYKGLDIALR